jgi:hypothetical protein
MNDFQILNWENLVLKPKKVHHPCLISIHNEKSRNKYYFIITIFLNVIINLSIIIKYALKNGKIRKFLLKITKSLNMQNMQYKLLICIS